MIIPAYDGGALPRPARRDHQGARGDAEAPKGLHQGDKPRFKQVKALPFLGQEESDKVCLLCL
jgi:hypothetical protein